MMPRTHWTSEEFWEMFKATYYIAEQLSANDEEVKLSKEAAIRFWLMFQPVGGCA